MRRERAKKNIEKGDIENEIKFQELINKEKWTDDMICHRTGLTKRSVKWIMSNGEVRGRFGEDRGLGWG